MILKIEDLVPNGYNPRKIFRGAAMEQLKASIKEDGLIEPLIVRKLENGKYEVVCGMRRYKSLIDLKIPEVECMVRKLSDYNAMKLALLENIQRENLNPIEEGRMYKRLIDAKTSTSKKNFKSLEISESKKIGDLSNEIKISTETIKKRISLLNLPENLQNAIINKKFQMEHGYQLSRLPNHDLMTKFNSDITEYKWDLKSLTRNISRKLKDLSEEEIISKEELGTQINTLKEKIKKIRELRDPLINGFIETIDKIKELVMEDIENGEIEVNLNNMKDLINLVEEKLKFYEDNEKYQELSEFIDKKEERISKIETLIESALRLDIRSCPFCEAGIDIRTLKENIKIYKEDLKNLNEEQRSKLQNLANLQQTYEIIQKQKRN